MATPQVDQFTTVTHEMFLRIVRFSLYAFLGLFSLILLALCADRINNGGGGDIVVVLLITAILAFLWSFWSVFALFRRFEGRALVFLESSGLFILWLLFLIGAAIISNDTRDIGYCGTGECKELKALIAFAWICWITAMVLLGANVAQFIVGDHRHEGQNMVQNRA